MRRIMWRACGVCCNRKRATITCWPRCCPLCSPLCPCPPMCSLGWFVHRAVWHPTTGSVICQGGESFVMCDVSSLQGQTTKVRQFVELAFAEVPTNLVPPLVHLLAITYCYSACPSTCPSAYCPSYLVYHLVCHLGIPPGICSSGWHQYYLGRGGCRRNWQRRKWGCSGQSGSPILPPDRGGSAYWRPKEGRGNPGMGTHVLLRGSRFRNDEGRYGFCRGEWS